ncbi:MAG: hypothetical protein EB055_03560 [Micrococcales bacterium]|nr:hypothetical protein [Micrococcales bacterium]
MMNPAKYLRGVLHPEGYHGNGKGDGFFEGWYVKLVSEDLTQRWAVIPGIFKGIDVADSTERVSNHEAFIQVLDGSNGRSWFYSFPAEEFYAAEDKFEIHIGNNTFNEEEIVLDLPQLKGTVNIVSEFKPWPVTLSSPGIMGWYGFVPFMECFHGIVSFGHSLTGTLEIEGKPFSFNNGKGYIETDWGKSFPSGYIWMQSNHFNFNTETSLIASAAIIPWLGRGFRGFIVGLHHEGKLYSWTTYNSAKEINLEITDTEVIWSLFGPDGTLHIRAKRVRGGLLHAPLSKDMHRRVEETMDSEIQLTFTDSNNKLVFEGTGHAAALEVFGNLAKLLSYSA